MKIPALSKSFQIWMDRMQELNKGGPSMAEKLSDSKVSLRLQPLGDLPTAAKYPLPQSWQILPKQFFEGFNWFTAYNRGKVFNLW